MLVENETLFVFGMFCNRYIEANIIWVGATRSTRGSTIPQVLGPGGKLGQSETGLCTGKAVLRLRKPCPWRFSPKDCWWVYPLLGRRNRNNKLNRKGKWTVVSCTRVSLIYTHTLQPVNSGTTRTRDWMTKRNRANDTTYRLLYTEMSRADVTTNLSWEILIECSL